MNVYIPKMNSSLCQKQYVFGFLIFACGILFYLFQYKILNVSFDTDTFISHNTTHQLSFFARYFTVKDDKFLLKGSFLDDETGANILLTINNLPSNLFSSSVNDTFNVTLESKSHQNTSKKFNFSDAWLLPPRQMVKDVNCPLLFSGDKSEQERAKELMKEPYPTLPMEEYRDLAKNCDAFKRERHYITSPLTPEEEQFPIAFSLVVFKEFQQAERLLRAIYRPQNIYCIHIDSKAEKEYKDTFSAISDCFDNVFIANSSIDVQWGMFSVLEPELVCMEELWRYKKWKYFINLTGQEFPLRTNSELVKILKIYNGANDMEGTFKRANPGRWEKAGTPPAGIRPFKGSVHITANRDYVDYVLHNETAQEFLNWTRNIDVPDETFFTTLYHNPHLGIRGSYKGEPETDRVRKPFLTRFKNWGNGPFDWPCEGKRVRLICIFGLGDLPLLAQRPEFFANKFYWDFEPFTLDCMEELHYNRTREGYFRITTFDTSLYESLDFVKNKVE